MKNLSTLIREAVWDSKSNDLDREAVEGNVRDLLQNTTIKKFSVSPDRYLYIGSVTEFDEDSMKYLIKVATKNNLRGIKFEDYMSLWQRGAKTKFGYSKTDRNFGYGVKININKGIDFEGLELGLSEDNKCKIIMFDSRVGLLPISNLKIIQKDRPIRIGFWRTPKLINCEFDVDSIQYEHTHNISTIKGRKITSKTLCIDVSDKRKEFIKEIDDEISKVFRGVKEGDTYNDAKFIKALNWDSSSWDVDRIIFQAIEPLEDSRTNIRICDVSLSPSGSGFKVDSIGIYYSDVSNVIGMSQTKLDRYI